ncbi:MAG TPA: hypothetical protein VE173_16145, partial [Longimicrobiales bacterium]|nr:hypothetical protein [Longimicrobiales bacterium]
GVEGYPVVVSTGAPVDPDLPSLHPFNHMIAAIRPRDEWIWLDLTVPVSPYGEVYGGLRGRRGVMLRDDGRAEVIEFPRSAATDNRSSIVVQGTLTAEGHFEGTYTESVSGAVQYRMRAEFARPPGERVRREVARNLAQRVFEDATTDSLELFDGKDLEAAPRLWAHVVGDGVMDPLPGGWMLPLRLPSYGSPALIARLEEDTLRSFPIDAEDAFGLREHYTEFRFELPAGWVADLPESVWAESAFGLYESTYRQEGRELLVRRVVRGTAGVLPPGRVDELVAWLRAQRSDDVEYVVLEPPGG